MKTNEIKSLIQKRIQLRKAKKYKEADKIRDIIFKAFPELKICDEKDMVMITGWIKGYPYHICEFIKDNNA